MYTDGMKCIGTVCAVGEWDTLNGKTVLRVNIKGDHGILPGVLWFDATDGKTVNGNKLPSSMERAKSLYKHLTGRAFNFADVGAMAHSSKTVAFTASKRITDSGNEVYDARFIGVPQGLAAFNAPSAATLAALFGTTAESPENPDAEPVKAIKGPAKGETVAPPDDDTLPF